MKAKRIRCEYCDGYYDSSMNRCPSCGATNSELIEKMTELYNKEDDTDKIKEEIEEIEEVVEDTITDEDETEKIIEYPLVVKSKQEGRIVEKCKKVGEHVAKGETILIIERFKLENSIVASADGILTRYEVKTNDYVENGDELFTIVSPDTDVTPEMLFDAVNIKEPLYKKAARWIEDELAVSDFRPERLFKAILCTIWLGISLMITILISQWLFQKTYEQADKEVNAYLNNVLEDNFEAVAVIDEKENK